MQHLKLAWLSQLPPLEYCWTKNQCDFQTTGQTGFPSPLEGSGFTFMATPGTSGSCAAAAGLVLFHCPRKWAQCKTLGPELTTRSVQGAKIWASPSTARTGSGMGLLISCQYRISTSLCLAQTSCTALWGWQWAQPTWSDTKLYQ